MNESRHITTGTDESGNTYKQVRVQDFTGSKTKVTNAYYLNNVKVTKYERWTVEQWIANNSYCCEFIAETK
jgi:formylglycine-generating enzyme required for sulfatase activity